MLGQKRLVGSHHMLAIGQCRLDQLAGDAFLAADQLHHHIGVGPGQGQRIDGEILDFETAGLAGIPRAYRHDLKRAAGARRKAAVLIGQRLDHAAAHGAQPGDGNFERLGQTAHARAGARSRGA